MCGIIAVLDQNKKTSEAAVQRGLAVLRHRGPDDNRVWQSPERDITLGSARLSIIDLSTGDQPIANEDRSLHVVVNGEFYDFE